MNRKIVLVVLLLVLIVGGYWFFGGGRQKPAQVLEQSTPTPVAEPEVRAPAVREISLEAGYFFFKSNKLTLKKGQPVRLIIKNNGTHTFTVDELGLNFPLRDGLVTVEFTPDKTGAFEFYCAIPGHRKSGQFGTLIVE